MLDGLVARGLKGGFDVEAAMARVDQARAAAGSARAARMPSGSLDGSAVRTRQSLRAGLGQIADYVPDFDRTQDSFELVGGASRSEERRVGKACVSTCRSRGSPCH